MFIFVYVTAIYTLFFDLVPAYRKTACQGDVDVGVTVAFGAFAGGYRFKIKLGGFSTAVPYLLLTVGDDHHAVEFLNDILTRHESESAAVVPLAENGTDIIDVFNRSPGADGRSLRIIHPDKLHSGVGGVFLPAFSES